MARSWIGVLISGPLRDARTCAVNGDTIVSTSQPSSFVIEREVPNVGKLSRGELAALSRKSCAVLDRLGPALQWIHSYVTADKIYCIYSTDNVDLIRRHAELGGFPANRISSVAAIIDPSTATE